jgi:hypothetical protein
VLLQAVKKGRIAGSRRRGLVEHHEVEALEAGPVKSKRFPDEALQPIAANGAATVFPGNGQAEPRLLTAVFFIKNRKHLVAASIRFPEDAAVGGRIRQPAAAPETAVCRRA